MTCDDCGDSYHVGREDGYECGLIDGEDVGFGRGHSFGYASGIAVAGGDAKGERDRERLCRGAIERAVSAIRDGHAE